MASLLARLKSRKKDKSNRREFQVDETRVYHGQDLEESSEEEEPQATSQPPPQLPALDFSQDSRQPNDSVRGDQHVEHSRFGPAETMVTPRDGVKGNVDSPVGSRRAVVPSENASLWDPDTDSAAILARRLQALRLSPSKLETAHMAVDTPACVKAREDMVQQIADGIRKRRSGRSITEEGRRVFSAAGLEDRLEARDTIDVHTRWLPPVVQEHVIRREHTEYLIVINREVHKYHIYPKILPVSDPQPILLEPRHRLFDAVTGQWHEVIGDQAAIDILGEDAFYNGPKEVRTTRAMALPGFGPVAQMTAEERRKHGLGAIDDNGAWIDGTEERLTMNVVI